MRRLMLAAIIACLLQVPVVFAATITQEFESEWTVEPWYYWAVDDIVVWEWHYIEYTPWDDSLGDLQKVELAVALDGSRALATEPVRIRYSFFTGWNPADYQFGKSFYIPAGNEDFQHFETNVFETESELMRWREYLYFPPAHHYFETRSETATHSVSALVSLTFIYNSPEIAIEELNKLIDSMIADGSVAEKTGDILLGKLDQALYDIAANNTQKACKSMELFIKFVETKPARMISSTASELMVIEAIKVIDYLQCK